MIQIAFINGTQQVDAKLRKNIRSHVMLGKNKGRRLPRKKKSSSITAPQQEENSSPSSDSSNDIILPKQIGNEYSLITFADKIEPYMLEDVRRFSTISHQAVNPLSQIIQFPPRYTFWLEPLTSDPICFHSQIFAAEATLHHQHLLINNPATEGRARKHYIKLLQILQTRLDDRKGLSDVTIRVINILVCHAQITGDFETATKHLEGIRRILEVRRETVDRRLMGQIFRSDLGLVLQRGGEGMFGDCWKRAHNERREVGETRDLREGERERSGIESRKATTLPSGVSDEIYGAWSRAKVFCDEINEAHKVGRRMPERDVLGTMAVMMYPLLQARMLAGSLDEAVRLGLLVFCSRIFLQAQLIGKAYPYLRREYQQSLEVIENGDETPLALMLWLSMMAKLIGVELNEKQEARIAALESWRTVQKELKSVMWVPCALDEAGRAAYESTAKSFLDR